MSAVQEHTLAQYLKLIKDEYENLQVLVAHPSQQTALCYVCLYGGTNTGKSSIFNLLLDETVSASKATASATKSAVLSVASTRADELYSRLTHSPLLKSADEPLQKAVEVSTSQPEHHHSTAVDAEQTSSAGFSTDRINPYLHLRTHTHESLTQFDPKKQLVFIDTPDHDSQELNNRLTAQSMIQYSDICLYVTTAQKYKLKSTIQEIIQLIKLKKGLKIGILFNMLTSEQNLDLIWQDLREQLIQQGTRELCLPSDHSLESDILNIKCLGALPRINHLNQANTQEKQALSRLIFKALNQLFDGLSPQQYILEQKQKRLRSKSEQIHALLEQAQSAEISMLAQQKADFNALLFEEIQQAKQLDQSGFEQRLRHLLILHYLSKMSANSYLLRTLRFVQEYLSQYQTHTGLSLVEPIRTLHAYYFKIIEHIWRKLIGNQTLMPNIFHSNAHLDTVMLYHINQYISDWTIKNGQSFLKAFMHRQTGLDTTQENHVNIRVIRSFLSSLDALHPKGLKQYISSKKKHDLIMFALFCLLILFEVGLWWSLFAVFVCSLLHTVVLSLRCLKEIDLSQGLDLSIQYVYQTILKAQDSTEFSSSSTNQRLSNQSGCTWWQAFTDLQKEIVELNKLKKQIKETEST